MNNLPATREIVGLDTETYKGQSKLLCNSNGDHVETDNFMDFVEFMERTEGHKTINMFFNLDYDIRALLSLLDESVLFDLHVFNKADYGDIKLMYIPHKFFLLNYDKKRYKFYDIFQYYYTSLNKASKTYLGKEKLDFDVKLLDDIDFWKPNFKRIKEYCVLDAILCKELGEIAQYDYTMLGIDFNSPVSTASLSEQFAIRYRRIPNYSLPIVQEYGYYSYWGGWFEQFKRGYWEEAYKFDRNSAYPYIMKNLPDIGLGTWELHNRNIEDCSFGFILCKIRSKSAYIQPLQIKHDDVIKYPVLNWHYRYLTLASYNYYLDNELADIKVIDYMLYFPETDYKPFEYMSYFYDYRKVLKDNKDSRQLAIKILMNSLYGKTIQVIERLDDDYQLIAGNMFLPVYASYITDLTRLSLLKLAHKHDIEPIAFYTDCIITDVDLKLSGDKLGEWSLESKGELVGLGSGVYAFRDGDKESTHIRGFYESTSKSLFDLLEANSTRSYIPFDIIRPLGLGELIAHNKKWSTNHLNEWLNFPRKIRINFDTKRNWNSDFTNCGEVLSSNINSKALVFR